MGWLPFWLLCAIFAGVLARSKGRSGFGWFVLGLFIGPFALLVAALPALKASTPPAPAVPSKTCPYCAERILAAAVVCRYCGRDLPQALEVSTPRPTEPRTERSGLPAAERVSEPTSAAPFIPPLVSASSGNLRAAGPAVAVVLMFLAVVGVAYLRAWLPSGSRAPEIHAQPGRAQVDQQSRRDPSDLELAGGDCTLSGLRRVEQPQVTTSKPRVNVREAPSTQAAVVGKLAKGELAFVSATCRTWVRLWTAGRAGWVSRPLLCVPQQAIQRADNLARTASDYTDEMLAEFRTQLARAAREQRELGIPRCRS